MRKWIFGAVTVAILAVGVIIRIPKDNEPRRPEVELVVQDHSYEETVPEEPLGPEVDPFPSEGWSGLKHQKWPDWVKFYRNRILFVRTGKTIEFAHYDNITWSGEGGGVESSPYNIPILIPGGKGLALVRLIDGYEPPPDTSAILYDPDGNVIGESDDLLGDMPTFDPEGNAFFVSYSDIYGEVFTPIRLFKCNGTRLFELNQQDLDRDLHRAIPSFDGTARLSVYIASGPAGFSEKRPGTFGVVVTASNDDPQKGPSYMLVYDTKKNLLGAVRLLYLHREAVRGLALRALSDPRIIDPKGTTAPFLTEIGDSTNGLLKRLDGQMCYRVSGDEKPLAGLKLGPSTAATVESSLGKPSEVQCEVTQNGGGSPVWRHRWVYRASGGSGVLIVEFLGQLEAAQLQSQDPIQIDSVLVKGIGFDTNTGVQPGESVWKVHGLFGFPYQKDDREQDCIDFIIEKGSVTAIQLHHVSPKQ